MRKVVLVTRNREIPDNPKQFLIQNRSSSGMRNSPGRIDTKFWFFGNGIFFCIYTRCIRFKQNRSQGVWIVIPMVRGLGSSSAGLRTVFATITAQIPVQNPRSSLGTGWHFRDTDWNTAQSVLFAGYTLRTQPHRITSSESINFVSYDSKMP